MEIRSSTDVLAGSIFIGFGAFVLAYGSRYPMGTSSRMGPGYYPMIMAGVLVLLGIVLAGRSLRAGSLTQPGNVVGRVNPRPIILVLAATLTFGLLIDPGGLILAAVILIMLARAAEPTFRVVEAGVLALALVAFVTLVFWYGLGLPVRLVPF